MSEDDKSGWEDVCSPSVGDYTERLEVPGGWIYRTYLRENNDKIVALAAVFVPDER